MINREVRKEIFTKLNISPPALSQRAKRIKNKYGPMTTEEAVYVIAHAEGIDLSKHLPLQVLDRIRSLVPREIASSIIKTQNQIKKRRIVKKIGKIETVEKIQSYPLVSKSTIQNAISIGKEAFPQMFVMENSIRALIKNILSKVRSDWWTALVPSTVQNNVQRTIKREEKYPYREKRGNEPLLYCNFTDLREIVLENKDHLIGVIYDFNWFEAKMNEIYMARNNLAHNIPLSEEDISRIALFYRDWARLLEAAGIK